MGVKSSLRISILFPFLKCNFVRDREREREEKIVLYKTKNDKNLIPIVLKEIF